MINTNFISYLLLILIISSITATICVRTANSMKSTTSPSTPQPLDKHIKLCKQTDKHKQTDRHEQAGKHTCRISDSDFWANTPPGPDTGSLISSGNAPTGIDAGGLISSGNPPIAYDPGSIFSP